MKPRLSKLVRFLCVLWLIVWAAGPPAAAQAPPSLGLGLSGGQPSVSLTGAVGTVYSIQYATGLSPTNLWVHRTLLQAQGASNVWTDPSAPSTGQRFYRAVSVAAPTDTNLVFIQSGTFTMGSPTNEAERDPGELQHLVTISRGFWMGKFLVTQADYLAVTGSNPSYFNGFQQFPGIDYGTDLTRPVGGGADSHELCVSVADGIGVGVCGPSGDDDGVLFGERCILRTGELQRAVRIRCFSGHYSEPQRDLPWSNDVGRELCRECMGIV